ncbi:amidase, partial [Phenoliferia sp. Uapishka_3]
MLNLANLPTPTGTPDFLRNAAAAIARREGQIPADLRLAPELLSSLPLNVTEIPASCGLLSSRELEITSLDATAVRDKIASRELSAVDVVTAFGKRAVIAHQLVNCLVDIFLEEGIAQAKALDEHLAKTGKVIGPLHGVPISIKDHMPIKGRWGSAGFFSTNKITEEDCEMVATLRSLGAVFFVKTNQPQAIMTLECSSAYGRTLNPFNRNCSPGGSSGGEGALLAMHGSCLGVGTTKGRDSIICSTGPMCTSARDIDLFLSALLSTKPYHRDPSLVPFDWTTEESFGNKARPLRVGFMRHDGAVLPQPPMLRGLDTIRAKLDASSDFEVVDFDGNKTEEGVSIAHELYFEDNGKRVRKALLDGGEDAQPLTEWAISPPLTKDHTMDESWTLRERRDRYRAEYAAVWHAAKIDVLVCAPFGGSANSHETSKYWGYTAISNLVDYPGVIFPTGLTADPALDLKSPRTTFMSDADKYNHEIYDTELYKGGPISLQLLAYRFDDCKLMGALKMIEAALRS